MFFLQLIIPILLLGDNIYVVTAVYFSSLFYLFFGKRQKIVCNGVYDPEIMDVRHTLILVVLITKILICVKFIFTV